MLSTFEFNKQNPEIVMSAKLYELLGLMLVNSTSGNADNMGELALYINRNYHKPLSLEKLAKRTGLSVSRFCTLFKRDRVFSISIYQEYPAACLTQVSDEHDLFDGRDRFLRRICGCFLLYRGIPP